MKTTIVTMVIVSFILISGAGAQGIIIDHVVGSLGPNELQCGTQVEFHIRVITGGDNVTGLTNGFFLHSDGTAAQWTPPVGYWVTDFPWYNWFTTWGVEYHPNPPLGYGSDTILFSAFGFGPGLPMGFDEVTWVIQTGVNCGDAGKLLCFEAVPYGSMWLWSTTQGSTAPSRPQGVCYEIVELVMPCGDMEGNYQLDVADLTYFVDYLFAGGPAPVDLALANVNGAGGLDVSDLTFLVDYLFSGGPAPIC